MSKAVIVAVAVLVLPLALFWISVLSSSEQISSMLFGTSHTFWRDVIPVIVLPGVAMALGAWEIKREGGPQRRDLLIVVVGFVVLSFIVIVGYLANDVVFRPANS